MTKRVDPQPFDDLIAALGAHGFSADAQSLAEITSIAWTTSSEMIGELGQAVLSVQRKLNAAPPDIEQALRRCMTEVRKVWPQIK